MVTPLSARNASRPISTRSLCGFSFAEEKTGEADSYYEDQNDEDQQALISLALENIQQNNQTLTERLKTETEDGQKSTLEKQLKLCNDMPIDFRDQILGALKSAKQLQRSIESDFQDKIRQLIMRQKEIMAKNKMLSHE